MPNYCYNILIIYCDDETKLNKFYDDNRLAIEDLINIRKGCKDVIEGINAHIDDHNTHVPKQTSHLSYHKAMPIPCEVLVNKPGHMSCIGYSVSNWGVKWDAEDVHFKKNEGSIEYRFTSTDDIPLIWLDFIAKKYNNLRIVMRSTYDWNKPDSKIVYDNGIKRVFKKCEWEEIFCKEYDKTKF